MDQVTKILHWLLLYLDWLQVGRAMYAKAGQLGLPVSHMPFKGFLLHVDEIEQLLMEYPDTKAIIDHLGFCNCSDLQSKVWQRLLELAKYPQVCGNNTRCP